MQSSTTPQPLSALAIAAQLGGAVLGGVIVAALSYVGLSYALMPLQLGMGLLSIQVFGIIIGFGVGAGLGAGLVGRLMGLGGNLWLALLFGGLSGILVVLVLRLLNLGGLGGLLGVGIPVVLIAALVGYNLRRGRP